jgi:hypothetical protein
LKRLWSGDLLKVVRLRGGVEALQHEDPELAAVHQHAHHAQYIHNQALDEQAMVLEDAVWNEDVDEGEQVAAQPEELAEVGAVQPEQNPVLPEQPPGGNNMDPAGPHRQAARGEGRWFRENANALPCPGARYTVMQIVMSALSILIDKSVHQVVFDLFMTLVSEALPDGNDWPRCDITPHFTRCVGSGEA